MSSEARERSATKPAMAAGPLQTGSVQVMGSTHSVFTGIRAGAQTRSVSRGRAGATESTRSPIAFGRLDQSRSGELILIFFFFFQAKG